MAITAFSLLLIKFEFCGGVHASMQATLKMKHLLCRTNKHAGCTQIETIHSKQDLDLYPGNALLKAGRCRLTASLDEGQRLRHALVASKENAKRNGDLADATARNLKHCEDR